MIDLSTFIGVESFGISIRNVMKKASKYQPIFAVYWLQCRFSTYFLPDWLLQFCIYFDFPYCFLFVTYTAKFPVCFFFILLKSFDFVTQSVVFFLKNL